MNRVEKEECPGCRAATVANHNVSERISEVWGASGGAIMGSLFAMGMSAEEMKGIAGVAFKGGIVGYLPGYLSIAKRMFMDLWSRCKPVKLSVYARYTRRGGLDINPFRTSYPQALPKNVRTARQ